MDSVSIGLDIGSSAVRAAEIDVSQGRRALRRYAQVGLPHGYVVDGEIVNVPGVSEALRRLWVEGSFSKTKVITGISGPRVFVRQADVPALNADDLRSSLKFDGQELIPIAMDEATFDFSVLDDGKGGQPGPGNDTMRILIVAAHRDVLRQHLAALKGAGLTATAIYPAPLALMRAVPPAPEGSDPSAGEVIVSIGAELTTVLGQAGVPRFIRSLTVGGDNVTETIANAMHLKMAAAERLKRGAVASGAPQLAQARKAMSVELRDLAEDVRGTVDFFMAQTEGSTIERLLITGGASQTEGLASAIGSSVSASVMQMDPFSALALDGNLGLEREAIERASASATTAVGLALWPVESPLIRLSVLPEEVAAARRARRVMSLAATGVAGLAVFLGVVGAGEMLAVHSARNQVHAAEHQVQTLTSQVSQLESATAADNQVQSQAQIVVNTLQGDIDWVRLLGQLAAVMPPNVSLTNFTGSRVAATPAARSTSSSTASGVGTLTFSVKGSGGLPAVSAWLDGLAQDQSLEGTWVTGISVSANGGTVTFSSTSNITPVAQSGRAEAVKQ